MSLMELTPRLFSARLAPAGSLPPAGDLTAPTPSGRSRLSGSGRVAIIGLGSGLPVEDPGGSSTPNTILVSGAAVRRSVSAVDIRHRGSHYPERDHAAQSGDQPHALGQRPEHARTAADLRCDSAAAAWRIDRYSPKPDLYTRHRFHRHGQLHVYGQQRHIRRVGYDHDYHRSRATGPTVQINAGGPAVAPFIADTDFSGSSANSTGAAIDVSAANSAPAAVYQTGRYGTFSYSVPGLTPNAGYVLRLHFAETYWNQSGKRIENVSVNGATALSGFDIFAAAGATNKAVVKTLTTFADSTGKITVSLSGASGSPDGERTHRRAGSPAASSPGCADRGDCGLGHAQPRHRHDDGCFRAGSRCGGRGQPHLYLVGHRPGGSHVLAQRHECRQKRGGDVHSGGNLYRDGHHRQRRGRHGNQQRHSDSQSDRDRHYDFSLMAQLPPGQTQQFTAAATDQFGNALNPQPTFTWAKAGYGTISTTGLFTAGAGAGTASITASSGGVTSPAATAFTPVVQINAGGPAVTPFVADTDFSGGSANSTGATIDVSAANSAPAAVYQTGRYGAFSYSVPGLTPNTNYTVRLHFAETYWNAAGQRIQNITINGAAALSNFDIFAAAGAENKAVVKTFTAAADTSGKITVAFAHTAGSPDGNALVAGLEVLGTTASLPPTVATAASATPNPVTNMTANVSVLGADGSGEAVLTYTWSGIGPAPVTFSPNGTNAAKNAAATFTQPGTYTLTATILDPGGATAASSVTVVVYRQAPVPMIMPMGDSITKGAGDPGSGYRDELYTDCTNAGIPIQFVGATTINASALLTNAGEQYHNGFGSYRIDDLRVNLDGIRQPGGGADDNQGGYWLTGGNTTGSILNRAPVYPQIVLVMAGTNDAGQGASAATMESRLTDLLTWFQTNRPSAQVYVAQITPVYNTSVEPIIQQYNQWIGTTIPSQFGANFHVVNIYSLFVDASGSPKQSNSPDGIYLQDGIHPSHNGYVAMGDLWYSAIHSQIAPPSATTTALFRLSILPHRARA